jgi:two-component system sensor histidine kinase YesM
VPGQAYGGGAEKGRQRLIFNRAYSAGGVSERALSRIIQPVKRIGFPLANIRKEILSYMLKIKSAKMYHLLKTKSLRFILVISFVFISVIPITVLQFISYFGISENFEKNINQLSQINVNQTRDNLEIILESYEDLLYQLYTDDVLIDLLDDIDTKNDFLPVNINNVHMTLRAMCNTKEAIESVAIITSGGNAIFYDKISGSFTGSSWLNTGELTQQTVYERGMKDYATGIIPTHLISRYTGPRYLFHLTHRIIDWRNIHRDIGLVILTLNEELLSDICNPRIFPGSFGFIMDGENHIISYPDKTKIGTTLDEHTSIHDFVSAGKKQGRYIEVYSSNIVRRWKVYSVIDQYSFRIEAENQMRNTLLIGIAFLTVTSLVIIVVTVLLSRSLDKVTSAMKQAEEGNLNVSIPEQHIFPAEIRIIVKTFNAMMTQIARLVEKIRIISEEQRDAEIKALEAQINPHFLYNILDSINWIAIDKDQLEISRAIVALAKILRYSINRSNKVVSLREEVEWIKQYLYLQQIRCKNTFQFTLEADESLLDMRIYKLLFQPFIENAVKHGFKNRNGNNLLKIRIYFDVYLAISIQDNGYGMSPETLRKIQKIQETASMENGDHIGIMNAVRRINMYYGSEASIQVKSNLDEGTTITIVLKELNHENGNR